jgi:NADPH-dependent 2,4-dienoyl-CoA reductase/sulfur reductase-like enzyme/rhodanese-related sulfurtransferase
MKKKKIIIIGGVAGGASAAARLRRLSESLEITIYEKDEHVSFANCGMPYYLSREIKSIDNLLLNSAERLSLRFNLKVKTRHEVIKILPKEKKVTVREICSGDIFDDEYDDLIISTGASSFRPPFEGGNLDGVFSLRNINDLKNIDDWLQKMNSKQVCIVGGGFIGIEVAEQLMKRGLEVTLIEAMNQVLLPFDYEMANLLHSEMLNQGLNLLLNDPLNLIKGDKNSQVISCKTKSGREIVCGAVVLGIGVRPEVQLALEAGIEIGAMGGLKVNEKLQTSISDIWAIGDCIEVKDPIVGEPSLVALGGPANKQGRIVADNILGSEHRYKTTFGTFIIRVFGLTAASTGMNERMLLKKGIKDFEVIYLYPNSHASYYPGAARLSMKVIFSKKTRKILGAQIIGAEGVDKRIDILSVSMQTSLDIDRLAYLELAYSPQYGSAKDPINLLGMIAENILCRHFEQAHWKDVVKEDNLLDVRSEAEYKSGSVFGAKNVPLDNLRENLNSLDRRLEYKVFCLSGQRSYNAAKILMNNGFKVKNLSGGYLMWKQLKGLEI